MPLSYLASTCSPAVIQQAASLESSPSLNFSFWAWGPLVVVCPAPGLSCSETGMLTGPWPLVLSHSTGGRDCSCRQLL